MTRRKTTDNQTEGQAADPHPQAVPPTSEQAAPPAPKKPRRKPAAKAAQEAPRADTPPADAQGTAPSPPKRAPRSTPKPAAPKNTRETVARDKDPNRQREAKKYENPIPSREFILDTLTAHGAPLAFAEIAAALELSTEPDLIALERRLGAMVRDGQLLRNRKDAFCIVNHKDLIAGRVIGHPDGFGFVRPDDGGDDLYLYPKDMKTLFHGDRVVVRVSGRDRRGRLEGSLVETLERNTRTVVGRLYQESGVGFVAPDNKRLSHDVIIPSDRLGGATHGQIVVAEITDQPTSRTQPDRKSVV